MTARLIISSCTKSLKQIDGKFNELSNFLHCYFFLLFITRFNYPPNDNVVYYFAVLFFHYAFALTYNVMWEGVGSNNWVKMNGLGFSRNWDNWSCSSYNRSGYNSGSHNSGNHWSSNK